MALEIATILEVLGFGKVTETLLEGMGRRVQIREIKKYRDRHIDDTLDVYERLFKEEHRVTASDLVAWLRDTPRAGDNIGLQQCLLIARRKGCVVGLLKAIYCPKSCCVFISYFGIDKKSDAITRKVASKMMLRFFKSYLKRRWKKFHGVLFEAEKPRSGMSSAERNECTARIRLFKDIARQQGRCAYEIKVNYFQPKMADASKYGGLGKKMTLIVIPAKCTEIETLPKTDIETLLSFLLLRVYATTQVMPYRKQKVYRDYLQAVYDGLVKSLPNDIELVD